MATLHVFNPETDYALAHFKTQYTPPKKVAELRRKLAMLPAIYAAPGDSVLSLDLQLLSGDYLCLARQRAITPVTLPEVDASDFDAVDVWGWNPAIAATLIRAGLPLHLIPSDIAMEQLRRLAHRRTTIDFHRALPEMSGRVRIEPIEFYDSGALMHWLSEAEDAYLKAPWSSSGRGVIHAARLSERSVRGWVEGIISSQGSVLAEPALERSLDFASEWICSDGQVSFHSLSLFRTDLFGRYLGNVCDSQDNIRREISKVVRVDLDALLAAQRDALEAIIASRYDGPVGIDMLATPCGEVDCCVELNLRRTMGMTAGSLYELTPRRRLFSPLSFTLSG